MTDLTKFQQGVLDNIRQFPGETAEWLSLVCETSPQAIGRAAMQLSKRSLAYSGEALGGELCYWPWHGWEHHIEINAKRCG